MRKLSFMVCLFFVCNFAHATLSGCPSQKDWVVDSRIIIEEVESDASGGSLIVKLPKLADKESVTAWVGFFVGDSTTDSGGLVELKLRDEGQFWSGHAMYNLVEGSLLIVVRAVYRDSRGCTESITNELKYNKALKYVPGLRPSTGPKKAAPFWAA